VKRREFISLLGGAAALPLAARAQQQPAMPVIGFLSSASPDTFAPFAAAFREGLREAGYVEGRNVAIEYRWGQDQPDRLPALAADLVRHQVAVIFASGGGPPAQAARAATAKIPIVFTSGLDPVRLGLVESLNRPGGNMTGVTFFTGLLVSKRLELLHELTPSATTIAVLLDPNYSEVEDQSRDAEAAGRAIKKQVLIVKAGGEGEFDAAFGTISQAGAGALLRWSFLRQPTSTTRRVGKAPRCARDLHSAGLCGYGRPDELRHQHYGCVPSRRRVCRSNRQGRETGRLTGPAVDEIRADHQPQDRQSARPRSAVVAPRPRRRGDRMKRREFIILLGGPIPARAAQKS
jgi:hypothetical protein